MAEDTTNSSGPTLLDFLAGSSKSKAPRRPGFLRRTAGAIAAEALKDTGHLGSELTRFIGGHHLTHPTHAASTRAPTSQAEKAPLSAASPAPRESPIGHATKLDDVEKQVIKVDAEIKSLTTWTQAEFKKVRGDVKSVMDVAQATRVEVDKIRKELNEEEFRKRVAQARIRNTSGKFMTADQIKADPSKVHPNHAGLLADLLKLVGGVEGAEELGGVGALLGGGLLLKGKIVNLFRRKPKAAEPKIEGPKTETPKMEPKRLGKGLVEDLQDSASDAMKWVKRGLKETPQGKMGLNLKTGLVGMAVQMAGEKAMDYAMGTPEEKYWEDVKKYGKDKANSLYRTRAGGLVSHVEGLFGMKADDPDFITDAKKETIQKIPKGDVKSDGDIVVDSKKNVSITAVQDILITARENLTLKAKKITLDAESLELKGGLMTLPKKSATPAVKDSKAKESWLQWLHEKISPFSSPSADGSAPTNMSDALGKRGAGVPNKAQTSASKAVRAIKAWKGGQGSAAAVDLALQERGLNEDKDRKAIMSYLKDGGVDLDPKTTAWCAAFVNSTLAQAGVKGTGSMAAGSFSSWGKASDAEHIKKGDILVNDQYSPRTGLRGSHVGMATGEVLRDAQGHVISMEMISGNESDMVKKSWEPVRGWNVRTATANEDPTLDPNYKQATADNRGAFKDTKVGDNTDAAIVAAAKKYNIDPNTLRGMASIESNMDPSSNMRKRTQYKGLFQIGDRGDDSEWSKYGQGGDIYDAYDNAMAMGRMVDAHRKEFKKKFGREPTDAELYLIHQQGLGFFTNGTMTNIAGNLPKNARVPENMTHEGFLKYWGNRLAEKKVEFEKKFAKIASQATADSSIPQETVEKSETLKDKFSDANMDRKDAEWMARPGPSVADAKPSPAKDATSPDKTETPSVPVQGLDDAPQRGVIKNPNPIFQKARDAQIASIDYSKAVPMPDTTIKSGEEVTDDVKRDSSAASPRGNPAPSKSGTQPPKPGTRDSEKIASPTNHPESERPRPGSDGYGDQKYNPDDCGICSM